MKLTELLACLPDSPPYHGVDVDVTDIAYDSRRVRPGSLFVAVWHQGYAADRHDYVQAAFAAGAVAAVVQHPVSAPDGAPIIQVPDSASALGWLSAGFHHMPSSRLGLVGVTGTDGKTTTSTMTTVVLEAAGFMTGMVTTVASKATGAVQENQAHTSTPEAPELQSLLANTVAQGGRRAVVESTSHALHQRRLVGCEFDVAVVTRVTHEHLDYHGTWDEYLHAKSLLLDLLTPNLTYPKRERVGKAAVLNVDDISYGPMARRSRAPVVSYGVEHDASIRAHDVLSTAWSTEARVSSLWGSGRLKLQVPGAFNVYNALAAIGAACSLGAPFQTALAALEQYQGVAGRMQRVDLGQPFGVIVDYAHTPDSLERVLRFLRDQTQGRVIVVFGCAGERDRQKRPWMGRIAATLSDFFILTDEDPRLEDRTLIIQEIARGAIDAGAKEGQHFVRVPDRADAITAAFRRAVPHDTVLLAGKGHEKSIIGSENGKLVTYPWDEQAAAVGALHALGYG